MALTEKLTDFSRRIEQILDGPADYTSESWRRVHKLAIIVRKGTKI